MPKLTKPKVYTTHLTSELLELASGTEVVELHIKFHTFSIECIFMHLTIRSLHQNS